MEIQSFAGASRDEALQAATTNPAKLFRGARIFHDAAHGQPANLVTFRCEFTSLRIETVFLHGQAIYAFA
ncbi:MAG: hypothetical protein ACRD3O_14720 [Terriglobia bacterium]